MSRFMEMSLESLRGDFVSEQTAMSIMVPTT